MIMLKKARISEENAEVSCGQLSITLLVYEDINGKYILSCDFSIRQLWNKVTGIY